MEGAAAFAAFVPRSRRADATLALSSFQSAYNLLDMLGEQPSPDPVLDGRQLHEALLYALSPPPSGDATAGADAAPPDWYEHHPQHNDGGYLNDLLAECRTAFAKLPSHQVVAPSARSAAARIVAFQSLNLSESQGDHTALEHWARQATPPETGLQWWETAAAAGSSLGVHVLIAAAADSRLGESEVSSLEQAYFPWIGGVHSLLDNLIDKHEDEAAGHRSLVEYYGPERAAQRMRWLAEEASRKAQALPHSLQHTVILAAMIGNYLSTPEAHSSELKGVTDAVLATTGPLARPTLLIFKLRRLQLPRPRWMRPSAKPGKQARQRPRLDNFG